MIYIMVEERSVGCSCSPVEYNEVQKVFTGPKVDLTRLREEYWKVIEGLSRKERQKIGDFSDWLVKEKDFKQVNAIQFDRYLNQIDMHSCTPGKKEK